MHNNGDDDGGNGDSILCQVLQIERKRQYKMLVINDQIIVCGESQLLAIVKLPLYKIVHFFPTNS